MFSERDHSECDARAKEKLKELFVNCEKYKSFTISEPSDPFTVDFYVFRSGNHVANLEVEVKRVWNTFDFPYKDIQILPRKVKFWTDEKHHKNKPTMMVMFNEDLSNHFSVKSEVMENLFKNSNTKTRKYDTMRSRGDLFPVLSIKLVDFGEFNNKNETPEEEHLLSMM